MRSARAAGEGSWFYCRHELGLTVLPRETQIFELWFKADSAGVFREVWELHTTRGSVAFLLQLRDLFERGLAYAAADMKAEEHEASLDAIEGGANGEGVEGGVGFVAVVGRLAAHVHPVREHVRRHEHAQPTRRKVLSAPSRGG